MKIATTPYIGLPFADHGRGPAFDCWGLVRHVLQRERGIELPDYGDTYPSHRDHSGVAGAIEQGAVVGWRRVETPCVGCVVVFRIAGRPWHVGLVVGADRFLHIPEGETSCIERLSAAMWARRIEGFYCRE
jgi:cell wall-associated NlpC family hydrolase